MLGPDELDKLADEAYTDRRIGGRLYCGGCGYCLRTLPYIYHCPECGQAYNARPLSMQGIFVPHQATVPWLEAMAAVLWGFGAYALLRSGLRPFEPWTAVPGVGAALLAILYVWRVWNRAWAISRSRSIERRIRIAENEES